MKLPVALCVTCVHGVYIFILEDEVGELAFVPRNPHSTFKHRWVGRSCGGNMIL